MKIYIAKPSFDKEFLHKVQVSAQKNCSASIFDEDDRYTVTVNAPHGIVGKFTFNKVVPETEDELVNCFLLKYLIIDKEYFPLELALHELTAHLKRKKIKYIVADALK